MSGGNGLVAIVMAAGKGTRMASERPKVLHEMAGEPLLGFVLAQIDTLREQGVASRAIAVVGHGADQVRRYLRQVWPWAEDALQEPQLGTGHAIMQVAPALQGFQGTVAILNGDIPLFEAATLQEMLLVHEGQEARLTFLTVDHPDPDGLGRILRDPNGRVTGIVEHRDATPEQRAISEINVGLYLAHWPTLSAALDLLTNGNEQGEYYLTDAIAALVQAGHKVAAFKTQDLAQTAGINNRAELVAAAGIWRQRCNAGFLRRHVTIEDPQTCWIGPRVRIAADTTIEPGVQIHGGTRIGSGCLIGSHSRLVDVLVGDRVTIRSSDIVDSEIGDRTTIGPFARLRDRAIVGENARIGNFVELKKVLMGDGAKAAHLTYLGDAEIGRGSNIGCGTVTCNYDGERKHRTVIGEGVFIGTNNTLVAPLTIGDGAYSAAGSTLTQDVPAGALAVARSRQVIKDGWVAARKAKSGTPQRSEA